MSLIQHDLGTCAQRLYAREADLDARIQELTNDAVARKRAGDIAGAKRRLVERKRVQSQRDAIASSLSVVEMHISTIEVIRREDPCGGPPRTDADAAPTGRAPSSTARSWRRSARPGTRCAGWAPRAAASR